MDISMINPHIRLAINSIIPSGRNIQSRIIFDYELIYIEKGKFTLIYDGIPYYPRTDDFIFIRPGISHEFIVDQGEISQPHIHFDITYRIESERIPVSFKDIGDLSESERAYIHKDYFEKLTGSPFIKIKNKDTFLTIFRKIISKDTPPLLKKAHLTELIAYIISDNLPLLLENENDKSVADRIKNYIDSGNGLSISLDELSKYFCYNKFYLEKKFKERFSIGIIEYRNRYRMEYARALLKDHTVSAVSDAVGFGSIYSFTRAYKQHFGVPPSKHSKDLK